MKKYNSFLLGSVCSICLAGYVFAGTTAPAAKPQDTTKNDITLAKFMFENQNDVKAFEIFSKYAAQGDPEAMAWLGRCYFNGVGTEVDYHKAYRCFSKAAAKDNPWGINGVGVCKQSGKGTKINLLAAMAYFKRAADMNFPMASLNLARVYSDPNSGYYDAKAAEEYFKKAIEQKAVGSKKYFAQFLMMLNRYDEAVLLLEEDPNDLVSLYLLIQCYENGWGVETDIKKSLSLRKQAYPLLQNETGWSAESFYISGLEEVVINGKTDYARDCFKDGADQGDVNCMYEYALIMQSNGFHKEALEYMMRAAHAGYDKAQCEVGKMLYKKDPKKAVRYLTLAMLSPQTRFEAVVYLSSAYRELKDFKQQEHWNLYGYSIGNTFCRNELALSKIKSNNDDDFALAAAWFAMSFMEGNEFGRKQFYEIIEKDYHRLRLLADKNNGNALFVLGVLGCLSDIKPNKKLGLELLEKSSNQNNAYACHVLGNIYFNGGSIAPKDKKKALGWYRKGANNRYSPSAKNAVNMLFNDGSLYRAHYIIEDAFEICFELGEFSVLYEYGLILENVIKDKKKAEKIHRQAAEKGDPRAMVHLYELLLENNKEEAFAFLHSAVKLGDGNAELKLGEIKAQQQLPREAFTLYMKAYSHNKSAQAMAKLAECWLNGFGCDANVKMFWRAADIAFKGGSAEICLTLGNIYKEGKIVPKDLKKAKYYYQEGAKRGNEACKKILEG